MDWRRGELLAAGAALVAAAVGVGSAIAGGRLAAEHAIPSDVRAPVLRLERRPAALEICRQTGVSPR